MKTKMILLAAMVSAAAMSANAGFRLSVCLPVPVVVSRPVVMVPVAPAPMAYVATVPACPGANYVWTAGYWAYRPHGNVWVPGAWYFRADRAFHDRYYYARR